MLQGYYCDDSEVMFSNDDNDPRHNDWVRYEDAAELRADNEWLQKRDGNATIILCFDDGNNPFARETLKVVDVGVSDNIYVVESQTLIALQAEIENLKRETEALKAKNIV